MRVLFLLASGCYSCLNFLVYGSLSVVLILPLQQLNIIFSLSFSVKTINPARSPYLFSCFHIIESLVFSDSEVFFSLLESFSFNAGNLICAVFYPPIENKSTQVTMSDQLEDSYKNRKHLTNSCKPIESIFQILVSDTLMKDYIQVRMVP